MPAQSTLRHDDYASGKGAAQENFPVASYLLPAAERAEILAFYRFARAADDIADHPYLTPAGKLALLDRMATALPVSGAAHAAELLIAFRQDAVQSRYASWDALMGYCRYSAAPVGRFLLDLFGEERALWPRADALCAALQVLNHLQDVAQDYRNLDRLYLPQDWLAAEGADGAMLTAGSTAPPLRRVLDRALTETAALLALSRPLAGRMRHRGLKRQTAIVQACGERLLTRLRRQDPLAGRVRLTALDKLRCALAGIAP
ncbi:squalene/phytoene synthase family protein [Oceanibaculum pacificum]|uniref:Squalene synthase HpnC n=1 Tax=Oceanibaculum pacificum TaxID=580166 RepID=A0A154VRH1_9PROT|nr:squalene/phytoene synthase family protein [Oceanibaculum pacificum]KZD03904.1 squalene synthase HpnC [Oceanibaculum pacificum]